MSNTYEWDENGSMIGKVSDGPEVESFEYTYNLENRLSEAVITKDVGGVEQVTTLRYMYNQDGIRVSREEEVTLGNVVQESSLTRYVIDPLNATGYAQVLEERDSATGLPETTFTVGIDIVSQGRAVMGGAGEHLLYDGHGSTRGLLTAAQELSETYEYEAYGVRLNRSAMPSTATSLLYTGEWFDEGLDAEYLRARWYQPRLGFFISADPFPGSERYPQSLSKYSYSENRPSVMIDPLGTFGLVGTLQTVAILELLTTIETPGFARDVEARTIYIEQSPWLLFYTYPKLKALAKRLGYLFKSNIWASEAEMVNTLSRANRRDIVILGGHGTVRKSTGEFVGLDTDEFFVCSKQLSGNEITGALWSDRSQPSAVVVAGCFTAALNQSVVAGGASIALGYSKSINTFESFSATESFVMDLLNGKTIRESFSSQPSYSRMLTGPEVNTSATLSENRL